MRELGPDTFLEFSQSNGGPTRQSFSSSLKCGDMDTISHELEASAGLVFFEVHSDFTR